MAATGIVQLSRILRALSILVQQAIPPAMAVIPIVIGANIGTTATALVASINPQKTARLVDAGNLSFNTVGVLLFLPFLGWFAAKVMDLDLANRFLDFTQQGITKCHCTL